MRTPGPSHADSGLILSRMPLAGFLARRRVSLGFFFAVAVLYLSRPTWGSLAAGVAIAAAGETIRVWAAGHLEKSREVTTSGPYQFTRHPLYLGSSVMGLGVGIASRSLIVSLLMIVYMGATIAAAIRTEEALLRQQFGDAYDAYAESRGPRVARHFSVARAWRNREYRAVAGFALFVLLLVGRMWLLENGGI
jgi:protein-S-isoprenylcysteine O-methyltransferase Ste14